MDTDTGIGGAAGEFPSTDLSLLAAATSELSNQALERVVALYWKPVYRFIRIKFRKSNEDAKDLTQGFFATALKRDFFRRFDPSRAPFRTYVRVSVDRFAVNQWASENRKKRGGDMEFEPLEEDQVTTESAEEVYEREWRRYLRGSPSLAERLRVIRRVAESLAFAHARGVIHRDLKPQNVMVGEFGEVYVMDWGVDAVAGTPAFRAPERSLDQRSDIYAIGVLLQFMVPQAPPALNAIARKAMRPNSAQRYPAVSDFLTEIERFQEGLPVEAWREPLWHRLRRFGSRNAVLLWLFAAYAGVKFLLFFLRHV